MSTSTEANIDAADEEYVEYVPADSPTDSPTEDVPEPEQIKHAVRRDRNGKIRHWYSGFCGSGPCKDGKTPDAQGVPNHHCLGIAENGWKVTPRYLTCGCTCHQENPLAVQLETEEV